HTQPRRLAARTVAERIATELESPLGQLVGYTIRFTDRVSDGTLIKVMTDGILLAEIQRDRLLRRYDTLIIDEAHERSLNIDFLLGYVKTLLPRRPDLKLIITSATIDTERFARHFDAPVIEVSGRTYPVEVRYEPVIRDAADILDGRDQLEAINDAVDELSAEGRGDILVFLSGEREIRDTAESLAQRELPDTQILPLYARLSGAEQHRVFDPHPGRRIVLATNVAETSLTVPGIHYVIDPGTARISRYSARTKVQRLPIEPISQASANQRAGRCGRVAAGVCVRLYSEEDFVSRPEFTEPEILRTNLASVILQMAVSRLGDIATFPFLDPPDARSIADGVALLDELGALRERASGGPLRPTRLGRDLARLPLDPRLGRMVLEAGRLGCLREVMIITSALSIQDPREHPVEAAGAANEAHGRFTDPESDFIAYVKLWDYLDERAGELSSSAFRRLCRREFLNYLRVREWQDLYAQLRSITHPLGLRPNREPAPRAQIHQALLAGLLSHIGVRDGERTDYLGARNARFALFPTSSLARKPPRWVMAEELVETSRLWAREAARIEPAWAERLGSHLLVHHYSEPHWDPERASAMAWERATIFGVPVVARRRVPYARVDADEARDLFIRHALVDGDWVAAAPGERHEVLAANRALIEEVRSRRRDVSVSEEVLWDHYDRVVGSAVTSGRSFDAWWKTVRRAEPDLLRLSVEDLVPPEEQLVLDADAFPDTWYQPAGPDREALDLALTYHFQPDAEDDGVSVHIPLAVLNQVSAVGFDWQVPGLREELITELIRSLPKDLRRAFVPVPDHVAAFLKRAGPEDGPLLDVLREVLTGLTGDPLPPGSWRLDRVPAHLRFTFVVETSDGQTLATSKDLPALQARLAPLVRRAVAAAVNIEESSGQTRWTFGTIPEVVTGVAATGVPDRRRPDLVPTRLVRGYPALVDEGDGVGLTVLVSPADATRSMVEATRRLLALSVPAVGRRVQGRLTNEVRLALATAPHPTPAALWDDLHAAAFEHLLALHGGPVRDEASWNRLVADVRADLEATVASVAERVAASLSLAQRLERRSESLHAPVLADALLDVAGQVGGLIYPGFVAATGVDRLADIERYLLAAERRLDLLVADPARDRARMVRVQRLERAYRAATTGDRGATAEARDARWLLEELRVSLFAQSLGTRGQVSEDRVRRAVAALARR
ncbi:MAG: ATP-dependent RNA helicase HrpA, partial [Acidimicrobiaceae bacterium]|nr:ATP-dependent RNA helicase HrpA [Acidimicrobiaceae bacterium]